MTTNPGDERLNWNVNLDFLCQLISPSCTSRFWLDHEIIEHESLIESGHWRWVTRYDDRFGMLQLMRCGRKERNVERTTIKTTNKMSNTHFLPSPSSIYRRRKSYLCQKRFSNLRTYLVCRFLWSWILLIMSYELCEIFVDKSDLHQNRCWPRLWSAAWVSSSAEQDWVSLVWRPHCLARSLLPRLKRNMQMTNNFNCKYLDARMSPKWSALSIMQMQDQAQTQRLHTQL